MTEIIPRIGYHLFPTRMIRWGWSFEDFLGWLSLHPSIKAAPIEEMRAYWGGRELTRAWQPLIEALSPEELIPEEWVVSAYPGRKRRYSYVITYAAVDEEGRPMGRQTVIVQTDRRLTKGEVLATAEVFALDEPWFYGYEASDFTIEYVEDIEFGR